MAVFRAVPVGEAVDGAEVAAGVQGSHQVVEDRLPFAAHHEIEEVPIGAVADLLPHDRGVVAAEHRDDLRKQGLAEGGGLAGRADLERHGGDPHQVRGEFPALPLQRRRRVPPVLHQIQDPHLVAAVQVAGEAAEPEVGKLHDVVEAGGRVGHGDEQDVHERLLCFRISAAA